MLARVLNPGVFFILAAHVAETSHRSHSLAQTITEAHQSLGAMSAMVTYAVRISGSAMGVVLLSSVETYLTTMRGNCVRWDTTMALKRLRDPAWRPWLEGRG